MGPVTIKTNEEKLIESMFESCFFKSFMACVLGKNTLFVRSMFNKIYVCISVL